RHRCQVAVALLLAQQRQEEGLEQQVAEFVDELRARARLRRLGHLVGLLDRVRHDRADGLLAVPRSAAATPPGRRPGAASAGPDPTARSRPSCAARAGGAAARPTRPPPGRPGRGRCHGLPASLAAARRPGSPPGRPPRAPARTRAGSAPDRPVRERSGWPRAADPRRQLVGCWLVDGVDVFGGAYPGAYFVSFFCSVSSFFTTLEMCADWRVCRSCA